jgi:uncharacterized protein YijF (DUF1287 family)
MNSRPMVNGRRNFRAGTVVAAAILLSAALASPTPEPPVQHGRDVDSSQRGLPDRLAAAAVERTHHTVRYDSTYVRIPYPGGDVPAGTGVCTDEVIRAYRAIGIDLQEEVHRDMADNLSAYPRKWNRQSSGAHSTDPNIDHRRVPNLMVFFSRRGQALPLSANASDYQSGDIVTWNLGGAITHIGIVVDQKSPQSGRRLIVHNIGQGPQMEDVLFNWKIIGHYRYKVGKD